MAWSKILGEKYGCQDGSWKITQYVALVILEKKLELGYCLDVVLITHGGHVEFSNN